MDIVYIRLDDDICGVLNRLAERGDQTVSELVNEVLREYLQRAADRVAESNF
jgi:predicted transcriptional regulator